MSRAGRTCAYTTITYKLRPQPALPDYQTKIRGRFGADRGSGVVVAKLGDDGLRLPVGISLAVEVSFPHSQRNMRTVRRTGCWRR
jgi:hypothetical protein